MNLVIFGDDLVQVDYFSNELIEIHGLELQAHGSGLGFRDIHNTVEQREDAVRFLHANRQ